MAHQASSSSQDPAGSSQIPEDKPTDNNVSFALREAQERASRKGVLGRTAFMGTTVVVLIIGLTTLLLTYTCVMNKCSSSNREIVSTAPLGRVLTISQVASHVAPFSVPIVMNLFSNLLGAMWLRSSSRRTTNRPSPMQLGYLLSLCNGANLPALVSSLRYIFQLNNDVANKSLKTPRPLRISVIILFSLLASMYLATAADAWLHATSSSVNLLSIVPYSHTELATTESTFGRRINSTVCDPKNYNNGIQSQNTCGLVTGGSSGDGKTRTEGLRVVSNSSSLHRVVFTNDQIAILVPQSVPVNTTYMAQTLGVKSRCTTVTKECLAPVNSSGTLDYGPNASLRLNCSANGIKYHGNGTFGSPLCALDANGLCTAGYQIPSNPFATGQVVTSQAYFTAPENTFDPVATGWFVHGSNGAWNVVYCNVTALDVSYTYTSLRYTTNSADPTDDDSARHIMTVLFTMSSTPVSDAVNGAGLLTGMSYEEAYSLELSKQALARGAYIYEPRDVLSLSKELNIIGSRLQLIPLVVFIFATLIFALQVLAVSICTIASSSGMHYVGLAAMHLNDPVVTVQTLYTHPNPVGSWERDSTKRFGFESDEDRLNVGPVEYEFAGQPGLMFAVTKGN